MKRIEHLFLVGTFFLALGVSPTEAALSRGSRSSAGGTLGLLLDGKAVGAIRQVTGGDAYADVVTQTIGGGSLPRKSLGPIKYDEITMQVGTEVLEVNNWIRDTLQNPGRTPRKSGAVAFLDQNWNERAELTFTEAFLGDITFPAMDPASKDPAYISLTLTPQRTSRSLLGKPKALSLPQPKRAAMLGTSFRVSIDGLDESMKWVSKVDAISVRTRSAAISYGELREYEREGGQSNISDLILWVDESHADDLMKWYDATVNGRGGEKNGTLEVLSINLKDVRYRIQFRGLGLYRVGFDGGDNDGPRRVMARMYIQGLSVEFPK